MKSLLVALQFLTRLPISIETVTPAELSRSITWFPVIGLFIGGILILIAFAATVFQLPIPLTAALIILTLVIITGGLHLDGLADMCDGFYAGKNREQILSIMRDSHIGTMGVIGIMIVLLLKYNILLTLLENVSSPKEKYYCLAITPMVSRWGMVIAAAISPYARNQGTTKAFMEQLKLKHGLIATLITLGVAFGLLNKYGLGLCFIGFIVVIIGVIYIKQKIGGVTGDTLGALNEILETITLFASYIIFK